MDTKKILIIDDERDICEIMKLNLERAGEFAVDVAYCGEEGLEMAKKNRYDLVITDFYMPGMDGGEVLDAVKEMSPGLPVLLFSIYHDDISTLATSVKNRADGIISKPIKHEELYRAIKEALAKNEK
jgi:DNA-binding NtrC family response regulator